MNLTNLVGAIEKAEKVGCIEHLDAWEESPEEWYLPLGAARALLKRIES